MQISGAPLASSLPVTPSVPAHHAVDGAPEPRGKPGKSDGGFCWQSKDQLRHIADVAEADKRVGALSAKGVYFALSVLASNCGSDHVTASVAKIAGVGSVGTTTASHALDLLVAGEFIGRRSNFFPGTILKAPCTYTIFSHRRSICKYCRSINDSSNGNAPLTLREETKEDKKKTKSHAAAGPVQTLPEIWLKQAQEEFPARADVLFIARKFAAKYPGAGHPKRTYKNFHFWIETEMNPMRRDEPSLGLLPEAKGWRELERTLFPESNETLDHLLGMDWPALPLESQIQFTMDVERAAMKAMSVVGGGVLGAPGRP